MEADGQIQDLFTFWRRQSTAPFHFPMDVDTWADSLFSDVDSGGRRLFSELHTETSGDGELTGLIQYGRTAMGFDGDGEISSDVSYPVIRFLCFDPGFPQDGQRLLDQAMACFGPEPRVYAFFHYFGMSACGRHGKLHQQDRHIHSLLLNNGFVVEHENVYYSKALSPQDPASGSVTLHWTPLGPGGCRDFTAVSQDQEVCWGQVHFLPQGDIAYLHWISVAQSKRHQGYGTAVIHSLFSALFQMGIRQLDTDTALDNLAAQRYYEKNGFINRGLTRSYFTK